MSDLLQRVTKRARALAAPSPKAMLDLHPEFADRVHLTTLRHGEVPMSGAYSYLMAMQDYEQHVWVRKAVSLVMNNLSTLPFRVVRGDEPVAGHDLTRLFSDVNDSMSSVDLWKWWCADMLLAGESPFELVKNARGTYLEIWPRQPQYLHIVPEAGRKRYMGIAGYKIDDGLDQPYDLPPDELLHFRFYNPRNPWRGLAVISAMRWSIVIDQFAQAWSRLFFRKSARPDYAVISKGGLTADERDDLEKKLESKFGGLENAHKPIVLEEEVTDIKTIDFRPKDIEWLVQRQTARDEIGAGFGVPDGLMGWGNEAYDSETKLLGDLRAFWLMTLMPLSVHRDTAATEFFRRVGALKPDERLASDLSGVAALRQDVTGMVTAATALFDRGVPWQTIDTMLGLGLPEFEGWEIGYLQGMLAPTNFAKALVSGRARRKAPEYGSDEHKAAWERKDRRLDPIRRDMKRKLAKEIERQGEEALRRLRDQKAAYPQNGSTLARVAKASAEDVFDLDAEVRRFKREFEQLIEDAVARAGQDELDELGLDFDFDLERPAVRDALEELLAGFAEKTNDTTYQALQELFERAAEDGVALDEIEARLATYFEGRRNEASVERIARTTMTGANGAGDVAAWEQSDVVSAREWLATHDDRVRDAHADAHGQTVGLDEPFTVGGEELDYPGDPAGSPENIVNCRCSQLPVVDEAKRTMPTRGRRPRRQLAAPGEDRRLARVGGKILRALPETPPGSELVELVAEANREIVLEDMVGALRSQLDERVAALSDDIAETAAAIQQLNAAPARIGMLERGLGGLREELRAIADDLRALPRLPADLGERLADQVRREVLHAATGRAVRSIEVVEKDDVGRAQLVRRYYSDGTSELVRVERDDDGKLIGARPVGE